MNAGTASTQDDTALLHRMLAHEAARTTDTCEGTLEVEATDYVDGRRYRREIESVFHGHPQLVAHVSQLQRPGRYVSTTIAGVPVIVARGAAGEIQAFVNRCRHRGAPLVDEGSGGGCVELICPYHGWRYSADDGSLCAIPSKQRAFPNLDPARRALVSLPTHVGAGFVWVGLRSDVCFDGLRPLCGDLASRSLDSYTYYAGSASHRSFDWKLGVEGFLENYHFAYLHHRSTHPVFIHDLALTDFLGVHLRAVAPKRSVRTLRGLDPDDWELRPHVTMMYVAFPSTCIFVERDHASVLQLLPTAAGKTTVRIFHIVRHDALGWRDHWDDNIAMFMAAVDEDLDMYESVQRGLGAEPAATFVFGQNEPGLQRFREVLSTEILAPPERGTRDA